MNSLPEPPSKQSIAVAQLVWERRESSVFVIARIIQTALEKERADALRHAVEIVLNRPITIIHRTILEASDPKIHAAIEKYSSASTELMGFTIQRTINLLAQAIEAEADKLTK